MTSGKHLRFIKINMIDHQGKLTIQYPTKISGILLVSFSYISRAHSALCARSIESKLFHEYMNMVHDPRSR